MMFLGVDGNEANTEKRVGSNVYAYEILKYLHAKTKAESDFQCKVYLKQHWKTLLPIPSNQWRYEIFGPGRLWTQWRLPLQLIVERYLKKDAPDLFFSLGHYAPRFSPLPTVVSIMDLAFLKFPDEFRKEDLGKLTMWTKYSVKNAAHIFTISQTSKDDVVNTYQIDPQKITVTYPGISIPNRLEKDNSFQHLEAYYGIAQPYLLYIGTLQPRKNLVRLIEAFSLLKKRAEFNNVKLVIVGKRGWLYQEIYEKVKELNLKKEVIFTGFISDYEKIELLKRAQCLVLPSLYEGFGIPVLEGMYFGTPVVASEVSSLPEVGGEAITYIKNPKSVDDIKNSLAKVLQLSDSKRREMIFLGKQQAAKFTWEECGKKTFETVTSLIKHN